MSNNRKKWQNITQKKHPLPNTSQAPVRWAPFWGARGQSHLKMKFLEDRKMYLLDSKAMCWRILNSTYDQLINTVGSPRTLKKATTCKNPFGSQGFRWRFQEIPEEFKKNLKNHPTWSQLASLKISNKSTSNNQSFTSSSHAFAKLPGLPRVAPPHTVPHPVVPGAPRKPCDGKVGIAESLQIVRLKRRIRLIFKCYYLKNSKATTCKYQKDTQQQRYFSWAMVQRVMQGYFSPTNMIKWNMWLLCYIQKNTYTTLLYMVIFTGIYVGA